MPAAAVTPFATRATRWLVVAVVLSLLAALLLLVSPVDEPTRPSCSADGYSRSAIGHNGLLRWLRAQQEPVVQSRLVRGVGPAGLLVLAEPRDVAPADRARIREQIDVAPATLVVMPKHEGFADAAKPAWVERVEPLSVLRVDQVGEHVAAWGEAAWPGIVRRDVVSAWSLPDGWPAPTIVGPVQLLRSDASDLEPLVSCTQGVLLGRLGDVHVLADPDVIANHGLVRGENAAFVLAMLRALKQDGAIVFDETLHGVRLEPSIWHVAGRLPLVLVTFHVVLLLALVAGIAIGRFGPVLPDRPAIDAGKGFLLDNVAALLRSFGDAGPSLRRYGRQRLRIVAEALQAPRGLSDDQCAAFVSARMTEADRNRLDALRERAPGAVSSGAAVAAARQLRTLTEDLLHARSRDR